MNKYMNIPFFAINQYAKPDMVEQVCNPRV